MLSWAAVVLNRYFLLKQVSVGDAMHGVTDAYSSQLSTKGASVFLHGEGFAV